MTNWYQSFESSAMEDETRIKSLEEGLRKADYQVTKAVDAIGEINLGLDAIGDINFRLDAQKAQFEEILVEQKAQVVQLKKSHQETVNTQRLNDLVMKSMKAMLSTIHGTLDVGQRASGVNRDRPTNGDIENRDPNLSNQNHQGPEVAATDMNPRYRNPILEFQRDSERSSSFTSENGGNNRHPKLEFPLFDGANPRSWTRKAETYFRIFSILEEEKVEVATMYMNGRANNWAHGFLMQNSEISWYEFSNAVCIRFGERQEVDVMEEFNKLTQMDDVEQYTEKFEELRASMLAFNPSLSEAYFMTSYINGLKQEMKNLLKLTRPKTLAAVYEQAKIQFDTMQAFVKLGRHPNLGEFQGEFSCSSIQDKSDAETADESLEIVASSQENTADQPFTGQFSMELISCSNGLGVVTVDTCHEFSKGLADFGRFSMSSLRIFSAYHQLFEEMPLSGFNFNDASLLQENICEGDKSWSFDPGGATNLSFQVLDDNLRNEKFNLQPLVNAHELLEKMSKKEILTNWVVVDLKKHLPIIFLDPDVVVLTDWLRGARDSFGSINSFIFDPGGVLGDGKICVESPFAVSLAEMYREFEGLILVYDPGGIDCSWWQLCYCQHRKFYGLLFAGSSRVAIDKKQASIKQTHQDLLMIPFDRGKLDFA